MFNWIRDFLHKRDYDRPTGKNLYTYKMSREEFEELEKELIKWLQKKLEFNSLSEIVDKKRIFNNLFVLYAAEWWKRRFSGGRWSWQPILDDLNLNSDEWSAPKRSHCVERGFRYWRIDLKNTHGLRFLGSVALQGGLPMNLLGNNHGSIAYVLQRTIDLSGDKEPTKDLIISWISDLSSYLPKTYRKEEIYFLLAEVIQTISRIKSEANSTVPEDVVKEWRNNSDYWSSQFPISVSEQKTFNILESLVEKVAKTTIKKSTSFVDIQRKILRDEDKRVTLRVELTIDEFIDGQDIKNKFELEIDKDLPQKLVLGISAGESFQNIYLRRTLGGSSYRSEKQTIDIAGSDVSSELRLELRDLLGNKWIQPIGQGEELDEGLPWIFDFSESNTNVGLFNKQGSVNISAEKFMLVMPKEWSVEASKVSKRLWGYLDNREIYVCVGNVVVDSGQDQFIIRTQKAGKDARYVLHGEEILNVFEKPQIAFRGGPRLQKKSSYGDITSVRKGVSWKRGKKNYTESLKGIIGPTTLKVMEGIYTDWKKKLVILPKDSKEYLEPSNKPDCGYWILKNWKVDLIKVNNPLLEVEKVGTNKWFVNYTGKGIPPESFNAEIAWKGNSTNARICLDFPGKGVQIYNSNGEKLVSNTLVSVNNLHGLRANILPADATDIQLLIDLVSEDANNVSKLFNLGLQKNETSKQLRLIDYREVFEEMLSITEEAEAYISFEVLLDGRRYAQLRVSRYSFVLENGTDDKFFIQNDHIKQDLTGQASSLSARAQRLDIPGIDHLELQYQESGHLKLPPQLKSPGPWIVYPSTSADYMFKPVIKFIDGNVDQLGGLRSALQISDKEERINELDGVIEKLVQNPSHEDWTVVAQLVNEFGHLPLSSLDMWKRLAHNYDAMAMLSTGIISCPDDFLDRFALELPFLFEFIPIASWAKASLLSVSDYQDQFSPSELNEILNSKLKVTNWSRDILELPLSFSAFFGFDYLSPDLERINEEIINFSFLEGPESAYQNLRNRNSDKNKSEWLSFDTIYRLIEKFSQEEPFLYNLDEEFRTVVYNTPILLAHAAAKDIRIKQFEDPNFVSMLRKVKEFDSNWYINAYKFSLAKLFCRDKIEV
ncbi:STY4851/ECs_5259 family protein [Fodinibius halophilus]|uniref:Uncharacterized protein n=1 Tax=Fodinibius halophilus TaxID=1736908 RepID=A0A6M1TBB5_9BACT|nr:STY4851/ECs_5259 family protein [Fodinibius halophilus]NGP89683.1 hypothetical protein [Fodinibius halophilus]